MNIQAPHIYQINTWTWLYALSQKYGQKISLSSIPQAEIDHLASYQVDMIWLMGIWQRSPIGAQIAREHPGLQGDYEQALPDYTAEDVVGSPYAVYAYEVDSHLGTRAELAEFRARLKEAGMGLILDFVPNHVAVDHPWTTTHPEFLLQGTAREYAERRHDFFQVDDTIFAHGHDPYFPAWTDTVQINAFNSTCRQAIIDLLQDMATQCDGVRCDMAMLMTNSVFSQTWGDRGGHALDKEFWQEIISAVKDQAPAFIFIAEVYWHMEPELQYQGFDYCYDKSLYDQFEQNVIHELKEMLYQHLDYQTQLIRFLENHDEKRARTAFGFNRAWLAAVMIATMPGAKLWHEGQFVGHQIKLPVQLGRRPVETDDIDLEDFYRLLLREVQHPIYREGQWLVLDAQQAWEHNHTHHQLIAYCWRLGDELRLIVLNLTDERCQGVLYLGDMAGQTWSLRDVINNKAFTRSGNDIAHNGLFVDLLASSAHLFRISAVD